ncbi:PilN domain-containing protein [Bacillus sp. EB106-08-02-XG196]|uniref:PilN domain-containing protein n=1 Tax=Bacillus sp. EB106-08-02-XG196 TaxID=2737049 RepID=UPI0015C4C671|nr:PilN domain-containing protein [Bacillus sp. EB106-08-02-XG196]NWQ40198.1 PilN domain-containing protein [Bacillus sp. EB106-08-02-XG196]
MLVEINLLPQKERGKKSLVIMLVSFAAVLVVIGGIYFWQIQLVKSDIAAVENRISTTKKLAEIEQRNIGNNEAQLSVTVLKSAVDWANNYPIQTVPVMQHLTGLLPERGFIQTFSYTEAGTVSLSVQFDSAREAAYFLDNLNESDWINEASLSSLNAQEVEEAKETPTDFTGTQTENNQPNINDSFIVTLDPNDPTRFIFTPVNPTVTNDKETTKVAVPTNKYVPRYIGQFEVKFTKETIKQLLNKGEGDEEGGTAS